MNWDYKFIDHTADVAVEITGDTFEDLLHAAFEAWRNLAAESFQSDENEEIILEFSEFSFEELLVAFLSELNYLFLFKKWISSEINIISIKNTNSNYSANIKVTGKKYNSNSGILKSEIKAVTFHQMELKNINGKYFTRIVFDI